MVPPGTDEQGGASPVSALVYGVTADVTLLAVLVAFLTNASPGTVVVLIGFLAVAAVLAYRATRRYLRGSRQSDPPDTP